MNWLKNLVLPKSISLLKMLNYLIKPEQMQNTAQLNQQKQ